MAHRLPHEAALSVGERVFLRHPTDHDRDEFLRAVKGSRTLHGSWVAPPTDGDAFIDYLRRCDEDSYAGLLNCRGADGAIVGVFNISNIIRGVFRSAFLGYYATAAYSGRGYMSEGLRLVVDYAFNVLELHRLEANVQPENEGSARLALAAGFRLEGHSPKYLYIDGEWRDHDRYALTVEDLA